ncbi:uncharacterized protein LOC111712881 [Eurytemora carolleeae]|uniref:uncharacterized protein LOC111712881 n=1 Tax=Eurytemora carolleeae TaxID=1294199 RepID=UPI000C759F66|nr:uncharacterized protein LOC111712881 [Eurytemora carolleeae]|eukprot:XP_023343401.1 uncharacterized protein LOC111712881 [Eurytemora affinis]
MQTSLFIFALCLAGQAYGFESCEECLDVVALIGNWTHAAADNIANYLEEEYCPTVEDEECAMHVNEMYPTMLEMIAEEFIILDAVRICNHLKACDLKERNPMLKEMTCDDCKHYLEEIKHILTNKETVTEMEHWLERHFCTDDIPHCPRFVRTHFYPMHEMAIHYFLHPKDNCNGLGYCEN